MSKRVRLVPAMCRLCKNIWWVPDHVHKEIREGKPCECPYCTKYKETK